uniref:ADP-ribose pyrophosphatase, mitochondrial n=1 Tax=Trichuris muris TaxID=70415 RepID=A0A5S6QS05_TRIMR
MRLLLWIIVCVVCKGYGMQQNATADCLYVHVPSSWLKLDVEKPPVAKVEENLKSWNNAHQNYSPAIWTHKCVFEECDPEISSFGFNPTFNARDGNINRQRLSYCHNNNKYVVKAGLPLNPAGRTGLRGRGILPRYGPNHLMAMIFIWEAKGELSVLKKTPNAHYGDAFIMGYVDDPVKNPFPHHLLKIIKQSLMEKYGNNNKVDRILKSETKKLVMLFGGNMSSPLDTDNAWIEITYSIVACHRTKLLCKYGLSAVNRTYGMQWYHMEKTNDSSVQEHVRQVVWKDKHLTNSTAACASVKNILLRYLYVLTAFDVIAFAGIIVLTLVALGIYGIGTVIYHTVKCKGKM